MADWDNHDATPSHVTSTNVTDADVEAYHRHRKYMKRQAEVEKKRLAEENASKDPRTIELKNLLTNLNHAVSTLSMFAADGHINDWVSSEEAMHARRCAQAGDLKGLKKIKAERSLWAAEGKNYLSMISWDIPDAAGNTALLLAVKHDREACVRFLLFEGANPNIVNDELDSCLHMAASREVAELLLAHGANPAAIDKFERTPYELHRGSRFNDMAAGIGSGNPQASSTHLAFKKEHQVRAKRTQPSGHKLDKADHEKAQALANEKLKQHQRKLDQEAHDALVARATAHYDKASGLVALLHHEEAVAELHECLAIFPDHEAALQKLRHLASSKGPSDGRAAARKALTSLIDPEGVASDGAPTLDVRQKMRSHHGADLMVSDVELWVEAKGMFKAIDTSQRGYLTLPQLVSRLCDFGLEEAEVQHVTMLMDANADDKITMEEFLAGFTRFKAMAHGKGAISLSAESEMQLHHLAHLSEKSVVDHRYREMQQLKAEAHTLVMTEDPNHVREADVLSIGGLPRYFFHGCKDEVAQGERIKELVHPFGFVMAATADLVDQVFGNNCTALAKFAMTCSVEEAIETGLSVKDGQGNNVQLTLAVAEPKDVFERVALRHLDLMARGRAEEAAAFRAHHDEKRKQVDAGGAE